MLLPLSGPASERRRGQARLASIPRNHPEDEGSTARSSKDSGPPRRSDQTQLASPCYMSPAAGRLGGEWGGGADAAQRRANEIRTGPRWWSGSGIAWPQHGLWRLGGATTFRFPRRHGATVLRLPDRSR